MDGESKQCYMCRNFERYYTKGVKQYSRTKFGYCREKRDNVGIHECCDKYGYRQHAKRTDGSALKYLSDLLTEISELRNVIEDERNGKDEL